MKVFQRLPRDLTQICREVSLPVGSVDSPMSVKPNFTHQPSGDTPGTHPSLPRNSASGEWGPQSPQYQSHWLTRRAWPKSNYHPREKELFMFLIGEASQKAIHPRLICFLDVSRIYEKDANGESQK